MDFLSLRRRRCCCCSPDKSFKIKKIVFWPLPLSLSFFFRSFCFQTHEWRLLFSWVQLRPANRYSIIVFTYWLNLPIRISCFECNNMLSTMKNKKMYFSFSKLLSSSVYFHRFFYNFYCHFCLSVLLFSFKFFVPVFVCACLVHLGMKRPRPLIRKSTNSAKMKTKIERKKEKRSRARRRPKHLHICANLFLSTKKKQMYTEEPEKRRLKEMEVGKRLRD